MFLHQPNHPRLRTFNERGKFKDMGQLAKEKGFAEGQYIHDKKSKSTAKIVEFKGDLVVVDLDDESPLYGLAQFPVEQLISGKWKVIQPRSEPEMIEDLAPMLPVKSHQLCIETIRAKILVELWEKENLNKKVYEGLQVQIKPHRAVFTTQHFGKNKLVLWPTGWKLDGRLPENAIKNNGMCLGKLSMSGMQKSYLFYINPCYVAPDKNGNTEKAFLNPCFSIRVTRDQEEATVEVYPRFTPKDMNQAMKIPCVRNIKPLEAGEELLCFVEAPSNESEGVPDLVPHVEPPAPATKRQRTKGKQT